MIYCPRCEGETLVYDSRPCDEGMKRLRRCAECGFRFRTTERVTGGVNNKRVLTESRANALPGEDAGSKA